jgi:hypothetical protein
VYKGDKLKPFNYNPNKKYGGKAMMVWGCITSSGVGYACRLMEKTMDFNLYQHILSKSHKETLQYYGWTNQEVIFQQDSNSSQISKSIIEWMKKHKVNLLEKWPANSPDRTPLASHQAQTCWLSN